MYAIPSDNLILEVFKRLSAAKNLIEGRNKLSCCFGVGVFAIVETQQSLSRRANNSAQRIINEGERPAQVYFVVALLNALQDGPILLLAFTKRFFELLAFVNLIAERSVGLR